MQNTSRRSEAGITFNVSEVEIAKQPLKQFGVRDAVEQMVNSTVEACSDHTRTAVRAAAVHPLFTATGLAFNNHYPLVLTPDIVWLTIVQGLATHINLDPARHRKQFVSFDGQKTLSVRREKFIPGDINNPWNEVFTDFSLQVREQIGPETYNLILSNFSTTGPIEKAASEVALMSTVKSFFRFEFHSLCGIPSVTLQGTVDDWQMLAQKIEGLQRFEGLEFWLPRLRAVAPQLVAASAGDINVNFWRDMYKLDDMSGGPYINGWLTRFLPYTVRNGEPIQNPCLSGGQITQEDLPSATTVVPFVWETPQGRANYQFLSGLLNVEQDPISLALKPKVGWAVRSSQQASETFSAKQDAEAAAYRAAEQAKRATTLPTWPNGKPLNVLAEEHAEAYRFAEAIEIYDKLIAKEPKHFLHRIKRGLAFLGNKQYEYALEDFNYVIGINPDMASTYAHRAKVYFAMGKLAESKADSDRAQSLGYSE